MDGSGAAVDRARHLSTQAARYADDSDTERAIETYVQALEAWDEVADHAPALELARVHADLAYEYDLLDQTDKAGIHYATAEELYRASARSADRDALRRFATDYGYHCLRVGRAADSVKYLELSLEISEATDSIFHAIWAALRAMHLTQITIDLKQQERAIEYGKRGLAASQKLRFGHEYVAYLSNTVACLFRDSGSLEDAATYYEIAMRAYRYLGDDAEPEHLRTVAGNYSTVCHEIAEIAEKEGDKDRMSKYFPIGLSLEIEISEDGPKTREAFILRIAGAIRARLGDFAGALELYERVRAIDETTPLTVIDHFDSTDIEMIIELLRARVRDAEI